MHHGEAIVRGSDLVGQTVNIAARVADLAGPGELLVSSTVVSTMPAGETGLRLEPIGPTRVKGVTRPIWLHRVVM
jgi:class 3 adenylate cyclase